MDRPVSRNFTALRIFYFFFYTSIATIAPYINLYFKKIGLSGTEIGLIAAIGPLIVLFGQPFWGIVADSTQSARRLISIAIFITMVTSLFYIPFHNFGALLLISIVFTFFSSPIIPLADTTSLEFVKQNNLSYGKIRWWGSFGFALWVPIVGKIVQLEKLNWMFPIYAIGMLLIFILSFQIPKYKSHFEFNFRGGLTILMQNNRFILFLIAVFLLMATSSANVVYFGIYIDQLGGSTTILGLAWMFAALSEVPIFLFAHKILQKSTALHCLMAAAGVSAIRWFLYTRIHDPALLLWLQPMHAITFGCYYLGSIHFVNQESPPGWKATGQTLFWAVGYGIAAISGNFFGGVIYQRYGTVETVYLVASIVALISTVLFFITTRMKKQSNEELRVKS